MNFYEITQACCAANVPARLREDVLRACAKQAMSCPDVKAFGEERVYEALLGREHQGSTGFGGGAAIPHDRFEELDDFVFVLSRPVTPSISKRWTTKRCLFFSCGWVRPVR